MQKIVLVGFPRLFPHGDPGHCRLLLFLAQHPPTNPAIPEGLVAWGFAQLWLVLILTLTVQEREAWTRPDAPQVSLAAGWGLHAQAPALAVRAAP